jgi:gamma-glutamyltranspeptidase/glutathione hydrolase
LVEVSAAAGGNLTFEELRAGLPRLAAPILVPGGRAGDRVAFLPPPADGGLAAAAAFQAARAGQSGPEAEARGLAAAAAWRRTGADPQALLAAAPASPDGGGAAAFGGALPASAGLVVFDRTGTAVSCAFTLNNLFGTGRTAPGMGFLLAAAPGIGAVQSPLLAAGLAFNPNLRAFRMAAAGSGQGVAHMAVAGPMALHLLRGMAPAEALAGGSPEPARTQLGVCLNYLPGSPDRCFALSDPRGTGVALGAVDQ